MADDTGRDRLHQAERAEVLCRESGASVQPRRTRARPHRPAGAPRLTGPRPSVPRQTEPLCHLLLGLGDVFVQYSRCPNL